MAAIRFVICFAAVFVQVAYTTPTIGPIGLPIPYQPNPCRYNLPNPIGRPGYGNRFPVESLGSFTSSAPLSMSIRSENSFQGLVNVRGRLPFKGAVALEGVVPSVGEGVVSYGIGDSIAIAEVPVAAVASPFYGPDLAYGPGLATYGPSVAAYGPDFAAYAPELAAYGPGLAGYAPELAAYGPGLAGCGRKGCSCAY